MKLVAERVANSNVLVYFKSRLHLMYLLITKIFLIFFPSSRCLIIIWQNLDSKELYSGYNFANTEFLHEIQWLSFVLCEATHCSENCKTQLTTWKGSHSTSCALTPVFLYLSPFTPSNNFIVNLPFQTIPSLNEIASDLVRGFFFCFFLLWLRIHFNFICLSSVSSLCRRCTRHRLLSLLCRSFVVDYHSRTSRTGHK